MATTTTLLLKTASTIILAINTLSLLTGTTMLGGSEIFPPKTPATALAESQIRYTAGTTAALGAIGWWAASDLQERRVPIAMAAVGILVGAIWRMFHDVDEHVIKILAHLSSCVWAYFAHFRTIAVAFRGTLNKFSSFVRNSG